MTTFLTETKQNKAGIGADSVVNLSAISKRYSFASRDFLALEDVFLGVFQGEILGVIGRNGAGKTTLLNIIAQVLSPSEGHVFIKGRVLGLFNLGIGFQDELTGRENIFLSGAIFGASKQELKDKLNAIIDFSELGDFIDMPLGAYSQGMRLRLGFSIAANLDFDILVIDEVLAVGDSLFQSKCFQKLMDFRRSGKTLILTTQNMELIERLCDKVTLLEHGRILFCGDTGEGINRYRALLNTDKFFIGSEKKSVLIENTKKWHDDLSRWGKKFGTKEVIIESVKFMNKLGWRISQIKNKGVLKIKVNFIVKNKVRGVHFGVAIFHKDGVYCYGPNTGFDSYKIPELKLGRGYFVLSYKKLLLAPGEYYFSVGIWDKNEALAFDYHDGCYKLTVTGDKKEGFLNLPFRLSYGVLANTVSPAIRLLDSRGKEKDIFITNELARIVINPVDFNIQDKKQYVSLAILRDDGVCCQVITALMKNGRELNILFPSFALLPGKYKITVGKITYPFKMVFDRHDHGTVYLAHNWRWRCF